MPDFPDQLRLKEQAEEDIYFAKRDRERIKALREKRSAEEAELQASGKSIQELDAEAEAEAEFEIAELFDDIGAAQLDELEGDDAAPAAEADEAPAEDEDDS